MNKIGNLIYSERITDLLMYKLISSTDYRNLYANKLKTTYLLWNKLGSFKMRHQTDIRYNKS